MPRAAGRQHFVDGAPFAEIALRHPPVKEYGIIRRMKNAMFLLAAVMAAAVSADAAALNPNRGPSVSCPCPVRFLSVRSPWSVRFKSVVRP